MKLRFKLLIALFLLNIELVGLLAQADKGEWLTSKQGLSQGYISSLLQDKEGFLWIGTKNGLNRYDGYHFEVFTNDPYDKNSLSNDYITCLAEFGGYLLVGTDARGLNIFQKNTRRAYRLPSDILLPGVQDVSVQWAAVDADGNIWAKLFIPAQIPFLCKITLPARFWQTPHKNEEWWKEVTLQHWPQHASNAEPLMHPDGKTLYLLKTDTLLQVRTHDNLWSPYLLMAPAKNISVHQDDSGNFWFSFIMGDKSGLYRLKSGIQQPVLSDVAFIQTPDQFHEIVDVTEKHIWLRFGEENRVFKSDENAYINAFKPEISGLPVKGIHLTDHAGLHWIGTNGLGILKVNLRLKHFQHLFAGQSINRPILEDHAGNIFTGNYNTQFLYHPALLPAPANLMLPAFRALTECKIMQDAGGNYWVLGAEVGSEKLSLEKIDPSGKRKRFPLLESAYWQHAMTLDAQGKPWIGINGHLMQVDTETGQASIYDFKPVLSEPHSVLALVEMVDHSWWIATNKGLVSAKPSAKGFDFQLFKNDPNNRNSLRNNNILALLLDPKDPQTLWIGTNGGGLDKLNLQSLQFTHHTTREGLPNDVIYAVLPDESNNLWLSSNNGLIRFTPSNGQIKNYTEEDGIQANEFNTRAYGRGLNGYLMFGGVNGITRFNPRNLEDNISVPQVHINHLYLNDQPVAWGNKADVLQQAPEFTREIVVPFAQNNITLEFVALDFTAPQKNRFRYYLEGAEKAWAHESAEHRASYLNLGPGSYTFWVKGCNNDGVWNETATRLKITVLPPWYRTWWTYLTYALLLGGAAYGFYRYQLNLRLKQAENERLKELDHFKSHFFTNITHEFRTPLTVILGMAERLEKTNTPDPQKTSAIQLIQRNGQNLLRLINEILDLAKLESRTLKINYVQGDVLAYLHYITESLHSMANAKNVRLRAESESAKIVMDYDPDRVMQIVYNLLSNAVKFTPSGGKVILRANQDKNRLRIEVSDSGAGIPPEDLAHVFERFYQAKNQEQNKAGGTGIGLSLTRELVKAMNGEITVESPPGKGAIFTVYLPITNQAKLADWQLSTASKSEMAAFVMPHALSPDPSAPVSGNPEVKAQLPRLLLIEDNPDVLEYLSGCLQENYLLEYAYNGRAGIEKALETVPDLIVSDVMMPEKDGFEVCDTLKNDERTSHIPIVLLTAKADVESRISGLRRGADAYLAKPFHREELLVQLQRLLENQKRLQERFARISLASETSIPSATHDIEDAFLLKLRTYLEANLSNAGLTPEVVCRAMGMGRTNLHNKLTALTGMPLTLYLRELRLRFAKKLLQDSPQLNISEVAYAAGFEDPKYFSRVFSETFGMPPSAYRT